MTESFNTGKPSKQLHRQTEYSEDNPKGEVVKGSKVKVGDLTVNHHCKTCGGGISRPIDQLKCDRCRAWICGNCGKWEPDGIKCVSCVGKAAIEDDKEAQKIYQEIEDEPGEIGSTSN